MRCPNHPEKDVLSFCHSCGEYLCRECLTDGEEYYFCKKDTCQNARLTENGIQSDNLSKLTQNHFAGFWRRFAALFIDVILLSLASVVIGIICGFIYESFAWKFKQFSQVSDKEIEIVANILTIITIWLYFSLMESSPLQGTIGKVILKIKVTDLYQERIKFGKATGRHFYKILSGMIVYFGFIMAAFTKHKQALHDILAGTLVIKRETISKDTN